MKKGQRILLTGAQGNLGLALQRLAPYHDWIKIGRTNWPPHGPVDCKTAIHAASDLLTPVWRDPSGVIESNLNSTVKSLKLIPPSARMVFISSCAVYGQSEVTREDSASTPISINGISKLLNEAIVREYCVHHGIEFQIFRIFNTFGGNDRFSIISHIRNAIKTGLPFKMYNQGISQRDFIHVEDAASAILELIEIPVVYQILNIGSGEATRIRDIVDQFRIKHPSLEISNASRIETEYSRAEITRLKQILPGFNARSVLDFIREEI